MSEPASISTGIAARYATAMFELAQEQKGLDSLESDVASLGTALAESDALRDLIQSPIYGRDEAQAGIGAVAEAMGVSAMMGNSLRLMASKRRLFVVPQMIDALKTMLADDRGEVTADVRAAKALTTEQSDKLSQALKASTGKDVNLDVTIDDRLIGGLVVKIGSRMIDTSVRAKLNALQNTMKEVR